MSKQKGMDGIVKGQNSQKCLYQRVSFEIRFDGLSLQWRNVDFLRCR